MWSPNSQQILTIPAHRQVPKVRGHKKKLSVYIEISQHTRAQLKKTNVRIKCRLIWYSQHCYKAPLYLQQWDYTCLLLHIHFLWQAGIKISTISTPFQPVIYFKRNGAISVVSAPLTTHNTFSQYDDTRSLFRAECILLTICIIFFFVEKFKYFFLIFKQLNIYTRYTSGNTNAVLQMVHTTILQF